MPEEVAVVLVVAIIAGSVSSVIKQAIKARSSRKASATDAGGITMSELRAMMRDAVEEATLPLRAEIEDLKDEVRAARGLPPAQEKLLGAFEDEVDDEVRLGQRSRTR